MNKKLLLSLIICGFTLIVNSQDDKKTPEKKLSTGKSTVDSDGKEAEKKMVDRSTAKKEKIAPFINGKPERKLVTK